MTAHPALAPDWLCESCRPPAVDCPCASWRCGCGCQRLTVQCGRCGWPGPHVVCPQPPRELCGSCDAGLPMSCTCVPERERADVCRCGGDLEISVGRDEEDGERAAVRVAVECRSCGRER